MSSVSSNTHHIFVIYDGYCGFCYRIVQFIETHDSHNHIKLLPRQSEEAVRLLSNYHVSSEENESVVVIVDSKLLRKSDATIRIWQEIGGVWSMLAWQRILPKALRDWVYDLVAQNRYRFFGRYDSCQWPKNKA